MKAIVIGAGVIGASVSYRLAQSGVAVTVLEANRVGGGTSGVSFAWTNSSNKPPRAYHDLNIAGMKAHAALKTEFGASPWLHESGCIEWAGNAADKAELDRKVARLKSWDYSAEWITRTRLRELEPDINPNLANDAPIAFYPQDGWLDPVVYANAMIRAAQDHGATLRCGVRVTNIDSRNGKVIGVRAADGTRFVADMVVNCTGRWADGNFAEVGFQIPLASTIGFLVFTPPVASNVSHPLLAPVASIRPDGAGRLMLRRDEVDDVTTFDMTPTTTMPQTLEVMRYATEVLPCLAVVAPEAVRITVRPIPKDGFPAVGALPRIEGYYVVITHSGVTLSPFLGQAVADEIARGKTRPELETFRPSRFFN
jgi:glycine/D-amino acid oxidase-like deaminating enzyme